MGNNDVIFRQGSTVYTIPVVGLSCHDSGGPENGWKVDNELKVYHVIGGF